MSLATNSILVNISISVWSGRKLDKEVSQEVDAQKSTKTRAGNYNKNLFAGVDELEKVRQIAGRLRNWHQENTLPWSDGGDRLLPMQNFIDYKRQLTEYEREFTEAVQEFCDKYPTLISAQAFRMGALFKRDEYPLPDEIPYKFELRYTFTPVPEIHDSRVNASEEVRKELEQHYAKAYEDKLANVTKDLWERLHDCLKHLADRLSDAEDGERKIFRDSLVGNAVDLCGLLTRLNVTNDPKLEEARKALETTVCNLDPKDLRKDGNARKEIKSRVDEILEKFAF
jgi:hypothetical protein